MSLGVPTPERVSFLPFTTVEKRLTRSLGIPIITYNLILKIIQKFLKNKKNAMSPKTGKNEKPPQGSSCRLESLIAVDDRGQMVLPKDLREKAGIRPGDKLALISWEKEGRICCFTLIKAEDLAVGVQDFLGPILNLQGRG